MCDKRKYTDRSNKMSDVCEDFRYLILNYDQPLVFKGILNWEILSWGLKDWENVLRNEIVKYRVGKWAYTESPQWDNKTETKTSTFSDFLEFANQDKENWAYCDYKHLIEHFQNIDKIQNSISWECLGFPEYMAKESTIWFGTKGAHTPCHKDTYGYNLVTQIYGRKLWLLFPPNENLRPTRIPYEESSIFSKLNFFSPNQTKFKGLSNCKMITLEPGDVLFVPHNWWHYVENLEFAISVNVWLKSPLNDDEKRLDEAIVQFLIGRFCNEVDESQKEIIINPSTDRRSLEEQMDLKNSLQILDLCRKKYAKNTERKIKKFNEDVDYNRIMVKYTKEIGLINDLNAEEFEKFLYSQSARFFLSTIAQEEENVDEKEEDFLFKFLSYSLLKLLDRCKGNNTQNNNESYNGLLWHFAPKHLHSGLKTIELSNYFATSIFNDGYSSILKTFNVMGVIIGPAARDFAASKDETRLRIAEHRQQAATKEGRSSRRSASAAQQAHYEEDEGELYGPGIAD